MGLMERRRAMMSKLIALVKLIAMSDTGLVSFDTNVEMPVKVTCEFGPKQDLNGYDRPWPSGGSANMIPDGTDASKGYLSNGYLNADGTTSGGSAWYVSEYFPVSSGETYTWSASVPNVGAASICFYDENKQYISGEAANGELPKILIVPENAVYCRSSQYTANNLLCQIEKGNTASPVVPYKNICPIEGYNRCEVSNTKTNIYDIDKVAFSIGYGGTAYANGSYNTTGTLTDNTILFHFGNGSAGVRVLLCKVKAGKQYTVSADKTGSYRFAFDVLNTDHIDSAVANSKIISENLTGWIYGQIQKTLTPTKSGYLWITCHLNGVGDCDMSNVQVEFGDTATNYESYQGETIPISWQSSAGTVHGGTVTLNEDGSADLAETWAKIKLSDIRSQAITSSAYQSGMWYTTLYYQTKKKASGTLNIMSDCYKTTSDGMDSMADLTIRGYENAIYIRDTRFTTSEDLIANMGEAEICYEIQEQCRDTYHFDNVGQLQSFIGDNNIWSDMNGSITAEYWKKQ